MDQNPTANVRYMGSTTGPWKSPGAAELGPGSAVPSPGACARAHAVQLEKAQAKQQRPNAVKVIFKN